MKKIIIITISLIVLTFNGVFAQDIQTPLTPYNLDTMYDQYYEHPIPDVTYIGTEINQTEASGSSPLFKRMRIKITNYFRKRDYAYYEKMQQRQHDLFDDENELETDIIEVSRTTDETNDEENVQAANDETTLELTGGVRRQKAENDMVLDCDKVIYDEVNDEIEAIGSPILVFPPQGVSLKADRMTYNRTSNILKAYDNVVLEKNGSFVYGDYVQINMNEENAFMDKVTFKQTNFIVNARKATAEDDLIIMEDGNMESDGSYILNLQSRMIRGQDFTRILIDEDEKSYLSDIVGEVPFRLNAEKITVEGKKEHDTITINDGTIYLGDTKGWHFNKFTVHTDKEHKNFEANYPELGSRSRLGMYLGPGWVFDLPNGALVKAIPFVNYKSGFGVGGALKYRSANNMTDFMYGSAENIFVLKGNQKLDDKLYLQYGVNSYIYDGFMGHNMAKYVVELYYQDRTVIKNTIAPNLDLRFRQKAGIGYMHNTDYNKYFGNIPNLDIATTRFKYMADINQSLYKYEDIENQMIFDFGVSMQGSAAVYGTGDTQFVGRIGPSLHTQYKRWMQDVAYYVSAYDDHTPLARFDTYRYGRSSLYIREALRVCKYLSVGWTGNINFSGDAPDGNMFQENAFVFAVGPDDFKLNLGYDFVRQQTYFAFNVAMDLKGSTVDYKRMEIKNPDRIAKTDTETIKLIPTFEEAQTVKYTKKPVKNLNYAKVIDIEDPDREQL